MRVCAEESWLPTPYSPHMGPSGRGYGKVLSDLSDAVKAFEEVQHLLVIETLSNQDGKGASLGKF